MLVFQYKTSLLVGPQTFVFAGDNTTYFNYTDGNTVATRKNETPWTSTLLEPVKTGGKHYCELEMTNLAGSFAGVGITSSGSTVNYLGYTSSEWGFNSNDGSISFLIGRKIHNNAFVDYGDSWNVSSTIIGLAINLDDGELYMSINGVWQAGSNPSTSTLPAFTGIDTSNIQVGISCYYVNDSITIPASTIYPLPTGYNILS